MDTPSRSPRDWLYFDIETDGDPWTGKLVALGYHYQGKTVVLGQGPMHPKSKVTPLGRWLADPTIPKVCFTTYDVRWLRLSGLRVEGPIINPQVMGHVLNENQDFSLEKMVDRYLGEKMDKRIVRRDGAVLFRTDSGALVPIADVPWDQMERYNRDDVDKLVALTHELSRRLTLSAWSKFFWEEAQPLTDVLAGMEAAGMPINLNEAQFMRSNLNQERAALELSLKAHLPDSFNVNSNDQVAAYLFGKVVQQKDSLAWGVDAVECYKSCVSGEHDDCNIEPEDGPHTFHHIIDLVPQRFTVASVGREKLHGTWTFPGRGLTKTSPRRDPKTGKKGTKPSVTTPDLLVAHGSDPWVQSLVEYRKRQKVISTYLDVYPRVAHNGRLYARFNQTSTVTGRLSSSEPNLQNQPAHGELGRRIRRLFKGPLVIADYSQLEPRLMAHYSADPVLVDVYRSGKDVYVETAKLVLGHEPDADERNFIKTVFLGSQYGAGPDKVWQLLALNGHRLPLDRVVEVLKLQEKALGRLFAWKQWVMDNAKREGHVTTIGGRRRRLKHQFDEPWNWRQLQRGERQAVNAIIQGSAGDIVARTMVRWPGFVTEYPMYSPESHLRLLFQVHDELGWDSKLLHDQADSNDTLDIVSSALAGLRDAGEYGHGFDLLVPLVFEPVLARTWQEKDGSWQWQIDEDVEEVA